jgi:hypothetical protein
MAAPILVDGAEIRAAMPISADPPLHSDVEIQPLR